MVKEALYVVLFQVAIEEQNSSICSLDHYSKYGFLSTSQYSHNFHHSVWMFLVLLFLFCTIIARFSKMELLIENQSRRFTCCCFCGILAIPDCNYLQWKDEALKDKSALDKLGNSIIIFIMLALCTICGAIAITIMSFDAILFNPNPDYPMIINYWYPMKPLGRDFFLILLPLFMILNIWVSCPDCKGLVVDRKPKRHISGPPNQVDDNFIEEPQFEWTVFLVSKLPKWIAFALFGLALQAISWTVVAGHMFTDICNRCYQSDSTVTVRSLSFDDDYEIIKVLGVGGFGVVYEARDKYDNINYAIKRIPVQNDVAKLLTEEPFLMQKLDHPGFVRLYTCWVQGREIKSTLKKKGIRCEYIYIQMELCKCPLSKWIEDHDSPNSRDLNLMKCWMQQIVSAVSYMHDMRVFHRDLKPSNILLSQKDRPKLCDFGTATYENGNHKLEMYCSSLQIKERKITREVNVEADKTRTGLGTELYMSPEQRSFLSLYDSKTDIFALGLIFAELCVVMRSDERSEIFDNYRYGRKNDLNVDAETKEFVNLLTQEDPKLRPTCREILSHPYLATVPQI